MAIMSWNEDLDIGVNLMNDQHKGLLNIMNALHDAKNNEFEKQVKLLNDLAQATVKHFQEEEAYMESIGFADLKGHQNIHKQLLEKFGEHKEKIIQNQCVHDEFFGFLTLWLRAHIIGIDKKYGMHSQKKAS